MIARSLPRAYAEPSSADELGDVLLGAYLAARSFAASGSGIHHKICHVLGGMFALPHAPTHAVVLPYVLARNAPYVPRIDQRLAAAFGASSSLAGLLELAAVIGGPRSLAALGMPGAGIPSAAAAVVKVLPAGNPAPLGRAEIEDLLRDACEGRNPERSV